MDIPVVRLRFGEELHRITDFVTPNAPAVQELANSKPDHIDPVEWFSNWVWNNVKYPTGSNPDQHSISAFKNGLLSMSAFKSSTIDFWQFPSETIGWINNKGERYGDCEDVSSLLCSLLRNFFDPTQVQVVLGDMGTLAHAWVRVKRAFGWELLEPTRRHKLGAREGAPYTPLAYFNDKEAYELQPGLFNDIQAFSHQSECSIKEKLTQLSSVLV